MAALSESELPHAGRGAALAWRLASDDAVARAIARGNDAAFAALFDRYHAPLLRYCRSMLLGADDAQDAAQNALTAALRALRSPDRATPLRLKPWLYRIAHNEALGVIRRRPAVAALDDEAAELAAPDDRESRAALRELLDDLGTLPNRQRSALVLRELEGLSYTEVGAALEMSGDAARTAVFEARSALWAQRDGRDSSCDDVRRRLSVGDGRTARSRTLRAHLDACEPCDAFAAHIRARRRSLRALFPLPIVAAGSGSGWAIFGGATVATKCAALCATAVVVGSSVAALEVGHHDRKALTTATAGPTPSLASPRITGTGSTARQDATPVVRVRAATRTRAPIRRRTTQPVMRVISARKPRMTVKATTPATSSAPVSPTTTQAKTSAPPATTTTTPAPPTATTAQTPVQTAMTSTQDRIREALTELATQTQTAMQSAKEQLDALRERLQSALSGDPE